MRVKNGVRVNGHISAGGALNIEHRLFDKAGGATDNGMGLFCLSEDKSKQCVEDNPDFGQEFMKFLRLGGKIPEPKEHKVDTSIVPSVPNLGYVEYNQDTGVVDLKNLYLNPVKDSFWDKWFEEYHQAAWDYRKEVDAKKVTSLLDSMMVANSAVCDYLFDFRMAMPPSLEFGVIFFPGTIFNQSNLRCFKVMIYDGRPEHNSHILLSATDGKGIFSAGSIPKFVACIAGR